MAARINKPKRRIPLPKKTERTHSDRSIYTRKPKHKKRDDNIPN
jgi:hypothetical protein